MAELLLDVQLEFDADALDREHDPTRTVAEVSRLHAEEECHRRKATLRHPEPREVIARPALNALTGAPVLLVATRWVADGPN